jgi:hypothetical protein
MKKNNSIAQQKTVSSIPGQPELGYSKIYAKDDNNWYYLDDTGIEHSFVTTEDLTQDPRPLAFANAATSGVITPVPNYINGPANDGVGATLIGGGPGALTDGTAPGKIDTTYTPIVGDIILVKNQVVSTNPTLNRAFQNGLYVINVVGDLTTSYQLTRVGDFDESSELYPLQVNVTQGSYNALKYFIQTTVNPNIGTSNLIFSVSNFQQVASQIAFIDTVIDAPLSNIVYADGTALPTIPGSGATLTSTVFGPLGTYYGLTATTNSTIALGFTRVLIINQLGSNAAYNGDYRVIRPGSIYTSAAGATSVGTTITVSSVAGLVVGMTVTVLSGTGAFAANTVVTSINTSLNRFVVSIAPTTPLSGGATVVRAGTTWQLRRIQDFAGGFDRYTRYFMVSNAASTKAGKYYFTKPNSPVLTNNSSLAPFNTGIGIAPINIFEYGGAGGAGIIDVGTGTCSTHRIDNNNLAGGGYSTVLGSCNTLSTYSTYSTISGGRSNTICTFTTTIGGGRGNTASSGGGASILGGCNNSANNSYASIGGGRSNTASNIYSTVSGGRCNTASGTYSIVSGGKDNTASGPISTIGGGLCNISSGLYSTISGGQCNTSITEYSTISGGCNNISNGFISAISGGKNNTASGCYSTVSGGKCNNIDSVSPRSVIGGGDTNVIISSRVATVAGGQANNICTASGGSVIGGGRANTASCYYSTISGGYGNIACTGRSNVSGGQQNTASGCWSTVGGGYVNVTSGYASTVSGGRSNSASGCYSTIGGGRLNTSSSCSSTVSGGYRNTASARYTTIGGGCNNTVSGNYSNVGGGCCNTASGCAATILGGICNTASGTYSIVSGAYSSTFSITGRRSHAGGQIATLGDAQISDFVLRRRTTDATSTVLTTDGGVGATSGNQLILQNNNSIAFEGIIVGKQSGSANSVMWKVEGLIVRGVNAASTTLSFSNVQVVQNTPGWGTPTLTANTSLGGLTVNVVGAALTNIQWTAVLKTTEVIYA